jgi:hypothetical protein
MVEGKRVRLELDPANAQPATRTTHSRSEPWPMCFWTMVDC